MKGRPERNWVWSPQGVIDMHRPERWGYVQFAGPGGKPGDYRPDPAHGVQARLFETYYAQRAYREEHGRYARSAAELGLPGVGVTPTPRGYEATLAGPGGATWGVTHDALVFRR